jgi:hypothetical protein
MLLSSPPLCNVGAFIIGNPSIIWLKHPTDNISKVAMNDIAGASLPSSGNTETVTFNVGGKMYQVSKSLIEQHKETILARMISGTWQKLGGENEAAPVMFVDRDGDRFAYVLDFLRYGHVVLPYQVSRELFLLDLDFFGISDVSDESVAQGHLNLGHVHGIDALLKEKRQKEDDIKGVESQISEMNGQIQTIRTQIADLDFRVNIVIFAIRCFVLYIQRSDTSTTKVPLQLENVNRDISSTLITDVKGKNTIFLVNECLKEYGLKIVFVEFSQQKKLLVFYRVDRPHE